MEIMQTLPTRHVYNLYPLSIILSQIARLLKGSSESDVVGRLETVYEWSHSHHTPIWDISMLQLPDNQVIAISISINRAHRR